MSAPHFKSRDEMAAYAWNCVARRAKLDGRFKRLKGGPDVQLSVINEAALRLLSPQVDPIELLPKPLQKKMRQPLPPPIGNIQLHRSPLDAPRWAAFTKLYRTLFELGEFWSVKGKELDDLVDLRLKKAREAYIHETRYTSKASDETIDQTQQENLSRLTEEGQHEANDAVTLLQNQAEESLVAAQRELRSKVEAVEDARVCVAGVDYYNRLPLKQRGVFHAICAGESDSEIARRLGVARDTARLVRAILEGFADKFQTLPPYRVEGGASPVEGPVAPDAPHRESKLDTRIADIIDDENASAWSTGGAEKLQLPEIDRADDSTLHIQPRRARRTERVGDWGPYTKDGAKLVTMANLYEGSRLTARSEYVESDAFARRFSDTAARHLQRKARESGNDIDGALQLIDEQIAHRCRELEIAKADVADLNAIRAEILRDENLPELAWIGEFCRGRKVSANDLLGAVGSTDNSLALTIVGPKLDLNNREESGECLKPK
jgi:hypothetical protein